MPRTRLFAMFAVAGEIGAVTGPVLGTLLLYAGFRATCLAAAVVFTLILLMHARLLPESPPDRAVEPLGAGVRRVLSGRRFLLFAAAYSASLVAYNQLYLALPAELRRSGVEGALGWLFALVSVQVVAGQMPVTERARRLGPRTAMTAGFTLIAAAFGVAATGPALGLRGTAALIPAAGLVVLLTAGHMLVKPLAGDVAARLAGERYLGAHLGALATAGGVPVLVTSPVVGRLLEWRPVAAWALLAVLALAAAGAMWRVTRP